MDTWYRGLMDRDWEGCALCACCALCMAHKATKWRIMKLPTKPGMLPSCKTASKICTILCKGFSFVRFSVWGGINTGEIMVSLLFNQLYKSVWFTVVPIPLSWTLLASPCTIQELSVFNDRIGWSEYVLHAAVSQIMCLQKQKFRNYM